MERKINLNYKDAKVNAIYNDETNTVIVLKGSKICNTIVDSIRQEIKVLRDKIINDQDIINDYIFMKDYEFTSLSTAASVCAGSSLNGRNEFKLENGKSINSVLIDAPDFIKYLEENSNEDSEFAKTAEKERKEFLELYPLEKLKSLKLEEYDKVGTQKTFMNMLEWQTKHVCSGHLGANRNKLFFQRADTKEYGIARVILDDKNNVGLKKEELFKKYMNIYFDFINTFDINNYNSEDYLYGANVIKINLVTLYLGPIITTIVSWDNIREILDFLNITYSKNEDPIALNIKLTKYIKEKSDKLNNISLYEITDNIYKYYNNYIAKKSQKFYAAGFTIGDVDKKQEFYKKEVFAIGWNKIGSLNNYSSDEEIIKKILELYPDTTEVHVRQILDYFYNLHAGDKIILKSSYVDKQKYGKMRIFAIGEVVSDFDNSYEFIKGLGHTIKVKWYKTFDNPIETDKVYRKTLQIIRDNELIRAIKKEEFKNNFEDIKDNLIDGDNIIYYGVPGCGKSYLVKNKAQEFDDYERILFHPDYTYSDFVGQILPKVEGEKITYEFTPGPFTKILGKALSNKNKSYCLIIEEINRGNASAIFGDIFQLLDRLKEDKDGYKKGDSEYPIKNDQIAKHLNDLNLGEDINEIYIPNNLTIYATMNSSDQNVFVLDTAFKRRWRLHIISNIFDDTHSYKDAIIDGTNTTWKKFVEVINNKISELNAYGINGDDKQIGKYFISKSELQNKKIFAEKVLLYLWEDVVKFDRTLMFKEEYRTLDELINGFSNYGLKVFKDIFDNE